MQSKGISRVLSNTTVQKYQFFRLSLLYSPALTFIHDYWKNHSFDYMDLCWQSDDSAFRYTLQGDCNHEIKRCLLLGGKVMTNLDSILKTRDITLPTKFCLVKAMVFPVVMYGCESWTIKKAEHRRIDAFELWCWRRLLRVPWTAGRSNQSILKEISLI